MILHVILLCTFAVACTSSPAAAVAVAFSNSGVSVGVQQDRFFRVLDSWNREWNVSDASTFVNVFKIVGDVLDRFEIPTRDVVVSHPVGFFYPQQHSVRGDIEQGACDAGFKVLRLYQDIRPIVESMLPSESEKRVEVVVLQSFGNHLSAAFVEVDNLILDIQSAWGVEVSGDLSLPLGELVGGMFRNLDDDMKMKPVDFVIALGDWSNCSDVNEKQVSCEDQLRQLFPNSSLLMNSYPRGFKDCQSASGKDQFCHQSWNAESRCFEETEDFPPNHVALFGTAAIAHMLTSEYDSASYCCMLDVVPLNVGVVVDGLTANPLLYKNNVVPVQTEALIHLGESPYSFPLLIVAAADVIGIPHDGMTVLDSIDLSPVSRRLCRAKHSELSEGSQDCQSPTELILSVEVDVDNNATVKAWDITRQHLLHEGHFNLLEAVRKNEMASVHWEFQEEWHLNSSVALEKVRSLASNVSVGNEGSDVTGSNLSSFVNAATSAIDSFLIVAESCYSSLATAFWDSDSWNCRRPRAIPPAPCPDVDSAWLENWLATPSGSTPSHLRREADEITCIDSSVDGTCKLLEDVPERCYRVWDTVMKYYFTRRRTTRIIKNSDESANEFQ